MRRNLKHLMALALLSIGHITAPQAAALFFTFEGEWEDAFSANNPADPLSPLIGTHFTGSVVIPTIGIDLDPSAERAIYEFGSHEAQFSLDVSGSNFDVTQPQKITVLVNNDRSEFGSFGPYLDQLAIYVESNGYITILDAGIKRGTPSAAFDTTEIPTPSEILSTAAISISMFSSAGVGVGDVFLAASHPLPALVPPGSIKNLLDIQVTTVPLPPGLTNALMGVLALVVASSRPTRRWHGKE